MSGGDLDEQIAALDAVAPITEKKERWGWYAYDWANSVYYNTVLVSFLPAFLTLTARNAEDANRSVTVFPGISASGITYYPVLISISVVLQLISFLCLGTLGDFGEARKRALGVTAVIGAIFTICFVAVTPSVYALGGFLLVASNVSMGLSVVYYNSYLPLLAANLPEVRDAKGKTNYADILNSAGNAMSNRGYFWGYAGGVILLIVNVLIAAQFPAPCNKWCSDCPAEWEPFNYHIDNETLVSAGYASQLDPFGTSYAWPGVNPPCDTAIDLDANMCTARAAYQCDAAGCRNITALGSCTPDSKNRCSEDVLLASSAEDEYCTSEACPFFRCTRAECGRDYDPTTCDDGAWVFRVNIMLGGVWWLIFTAIPLATLHTRPRPPLPEGISHMREGVRRVIVTLRKRHLLPNTFRFLLAYLLYSDGIATILTGAVLIAGEPPLSLTALDLGILVLLINFVGGAGVMAFDAFTRRFSEWYIASERGQARAKRDGVDRVPVNWITKYVILFNVACLVLVPVLAVASLRTKTEFFIVAGGLYATNFASVQSYSRSLLASLTPKGMESEFSTFHQLTDRGTSFISPVILAVIAEATGSMRLGVFVMGIMLLAGFVVMWKVDVDQGMREAAGFHAETIDEGVTASGRSIRAALSSRMSTRDKDEPDEDAVPLRTTEEGAE